MWWNMSYVLRFWFPVSIFLVNSLWMEAKTSLDNDISVLARIRYILIAGLNIYDRPCCTGDYHRDYTTIGSSDYSISKERQVNRSSLNEMIGYQNVSLVAVATGLSQYIYAVLWIPPKNENPFTWKDCHCIETEPSFTVYMACPVWCFRRDR